MNTRPKASPPRRVVRAGLAISTKRAPFRDRLALCPIIRASANILQARRGQAKGEARSPHLIDERARKAGALASTAGPRAPPVPPHVAAGSQLTRIVYAKSAGPAG